MAGKKKLQAEDNRQEIGDGEEPQKTEQLEPLQQEKEDNFPIVGIGASAGGLEAFEAFFRHMPPDNGMAFVLVQHLDPDHESILVDLLKRATQMTVLQVQDGMRVQPNHIYVIPPNRDMALLNGTLQLLIPAEPRGHRMPIDFLFRSLAEDQAAGAIGIVLSGTGTDGTLGLRMIRGEGGMSMVQDPATAKYNGMPQSAINTGLIDYVLSPDAMPDQLINYSRRFFAPGVKRATPPQPTNSDALDKIFVLLRRQTRHDFSLYKLNTINRRIERRMAVNQLDRVADYLRYLQNTPLEVETLFRELLIGVTSFFRDSEAFAVLEHQAISHLLENRRLDQPIRVWVPGCSTGEEAYSIGMLIRDQMSENLQEYGIQIFATDIDAQAIETARRGIYPDSIAADITPERLQRYFVKEGNNYQVTSQIREMVVFAIQSIIKDPPFSKMDLISCRNLLIYLSPALQKKVLPLFSYALKPGGFLFLGTSETLGDYDHYFTAVDRKAKLFQRKAGETVPQGSLDFTIPQQLEDRLDPAFTFPEKELNVRELTERVLLQDHTPPCVIVNEQYDILFFHGKTGSFLEPASGEASLNLLRMAREGLRLPLSTILRKAFAQRQKIIHENVRLYTEEGDRIIDLIVNPVSRSISMQDLFLVVFQDHTPPQRTEASESEVVIEVTDERERRLADMEHELQSTREYLQTTIEELETANEELKSTNEELQSSNEELQSTNEELETAREELQSVNEELVTVNSELQNKIDDLTRINNDLHNLLTSVEVGIIFVDLNLFVQRFNLAATLLVNLIETDIGRPINHIVSNLVYPNLVHDAREVLDTLVSKEMEVQTEDGRWYWMRLRPYRTTDNVIQGLVMTFADITQQKQSEERAQAAQMYAENIVETVRESLIVLDNTLRIITANTSFYETFQVKQEETEGVLIYDLGNRQWDIPELRDLLVSILQENTVFNDFRVEHEFENIGKRTMLLNARQIPSPLPSEILILLAIEDATENK